MSPRRRTWIGHVPAAVAALALLLSLSVIDAARPAAAVAAGQTIVATGSQHSCVLTSSGAVSCWGWNNHGQLGNGSPKSSDVPVAVHGLPPATAVSAGGEHACVLGASGAAWCWGRGDSGQLGDGGSGAIVPTPVPVSGGLSFKQISAGALATCAVTTSGRAYCWGSNKDGQVGDGTQVNRMVPSPVSTLRNNVVEVASGYTHACALLTTGAVWCWGNNAHGQLGINSTTSSTVPVQVKGIGSATAVSAGENFTCAILSSTGMRCWGENNVSQLGDGTTTDRLQPAVIFVGGVTEVAAGGQHTCALVTGPSTAVDCWGQDGSGEVGRGSLHDVVSRPVQAFGMVGNPASGFGTPVQVAAGQWHSCAVLATGEVECWGRNQLGQVGDGTNGNRDIPTMVIGVTAGPQGLSEGAAVGCALTQALTASCWGAIAGTDFNPHSTAAAVPGLTTTTALVAAGWADACALGSDGSLRCWGGNGSGEVGDGDTSQHPTPQPVAGMSTGVQAVTMGESAACSIAINHALSCWGGNDHGQLGVGSTANKDVPQHVGLGVTQVSAEGWKHTCAVDTVGAVHCWGSNASGELGDGTTTSTSSPVLVQGLPAQAVQVATGGGYTASFSPVGFSCALLTTGDVFCWGYDGEGELGNGTANTTPNTTPVLVQLSGHARAVVAGLDSACAMLVAGGVQCWGDDTFGQLGDGGSTAQDAPVNVAGLSGGVEQISSDDALSTCALVTGPAQVECWGDNTNDELGDGASGGFSTTPQAVQGL